MLHRPCEVALPVRLGVFVLLNPVILLHIAIKCAEYSYEPTSASLPKSQQSSSEGPIKRRRQCQQLESCYLLLCRGSGK